VLPRRLVTEADPVTVEAKNCGDAPVQVVVVYPLLLLVLLAPIGMLVLVVLALQEPELTVHQVVPVLLDLTCSAL